MKTDHRPRFISKKGKPFAAYLKLEESKITFEFIPFPKRCANFGNEMNLELAG